MATTARKIVADIRNIISSGSNPNEFKIEDEQILFWINEIRSMLISQAIQRKQDISDVWIQTLGCVELEQVDISDCCTVPIGCYGLRSIKQLPDTVETDRDNLILTVTGLDGTYISKVNRFSQKYKEFNKFTGNNKGWFIKDNYLHIVNDKILSMVTVQGIFEDPSDLRRFVDCSGVNCWNWDSNYPCSMKMASMITDIVVKTKALPFIQFPADNTNDAINTPQSQAPKTV